MEGPSSRLKDSTEALMMVGQEQALSTTLIEVGVYHIRLDSRCRLCRDVPETIQLITEESKMVAGRAYLEFTRPIQEHLQ